MYTKFIQCVGFFNKLFHYLFCRFFSLLYPRACNIVASEKIWILLSLTW